MNDNIINFNQKKHLSIDEILDKAKEIGLEEIYIIGKKSDRNYLISSHIEDITKTVGVLKCMKLHVFQSWDG